MSETRAADPRLLDFLDSKQFNDALYAYRVVSVCDPDRVLQRFEDVKALIVDQVTPWLRGDALPPPRRTPETTTDEEAKDPRV
jgi:hypothetical protein